jgi:hypothetical protein
MKEKIKTIGIMLMFLAMIIFPLLMMLIYPEAYVMPVYSL